MSSVDDYDEESQAYNYVPTTSMTDLARRSSSRRIQMTQSEVDESIDCADFDEN